MRKVLLLFVSIPILTFGQNITNTLGTNGLFIVEDVNNSGLIRASRSTSPRIILGDFENSFNLPSGGDVDIVHNNGSERLNLVVGKGSTFNAFPRLNFYYTPGDLSATFTSGTHDVADGNNLGVISFFGVNSANWASNSAVTISAQVDGTPSSTVPGKFTVAVQDNVNNTHAMALSSDGAFEVDANGANNKFTISGGGEITSENLAGGGGSLVTVSATGTLGRLSGALTLSSLSGNGAAPVQVDASGQLIRDKNLDGVSIVGSSSLVGTLTGGTIESTTMNNSTISSTTTISGSTISNGILSNPSMSNPSISSLPSGSGNDLQLNGTSIVEVVSDKRLKTNIKSLDFGLAEIMQLKPVTYNWKKDQKGAAINYGFIAQDIYPILPEMVPLGDDGYHRYRANYLIPVLVNAMQEQQAQIEKLQLEKDKLTSAIKEQEDRLNSLEAQILEIQNQVSPLKAEK